MNDYKEILRNITKILLKDEDNYGDIKESCDNLYKLFSDVSKLEEDDEENREHYYLPKGKAIGTVWAGFCIKEFMRTKRFIRGVFYGIKRAQEKFKGTPINILYAGTGPFATLMIPLTTIFKSNEVKFTLLEINPNSIEILKNVIKVFEAEKYVDKIVQCDATEYKEDAGKTIHMIITETMQNALKNEPQVSIVLNLVSQMDKDGILIPQNVSIEAALIDTKREMERIMGVNEKGDDFYYPLSKIFELNKESAKEIVKSKTCCFPEVEIEIPYMINKKYSRLSLFTNIQVFGEEKLTYNECSLNLPYKIMDIDWENSDVKKLVFQYVANEKPGFRYNAY